jgi:hypothetical protein
MARERISDTTRIPSPAGGADRVAAGICRRNPFRPAAWACGAISLCSSKERSKRITGMSITSLTVVFENSGARTALDLCVYLKGLAPPHALEIGGSRSPVTQTSALTVARGEEASMVPLVRRCRNATCTVSKICGSANSGQSFHVVPLMRRFAAVATARDQ